ncbi:MAG TPA: SEC-C metal-binding domain-containing protein [Candidatus Angelobacter sp.]|nr:SEC-C metal-binding domain-containing protein [Candidatus Angelobacter sp.]
MAFRALKGGIKDLQEKLGRNDLCPCGSGRTFQEVLYEV